jgi:DNA-binding response OmpR family regulator
VLHEADASVMSLPERVLVVAPSRPLARALAATLKSGRYAPVVVSDFIVAKTLLEARPDFLISELKLGAYNGLHLAIRAAGQGTPAIIIGDADPVLEAEAVRYKATFLKSPVDPEHVLVLMRAIRASSQQKRRSPRKQVGVLDAYVNEVRARLLDVSYEGMRLESSETELSALPPLVTVRLPLFNFSCRVQRVWTSQPSNEGSGVACGAELSTSDADTAVAWRVLVDSLPGASLTT